MAEFNFETLNVKSDYVNYLAMDGFAQMLKDPAYSYKFYWLEAIIKIISEGRKSSTLNEIIDEMIANAWYTVREYHIHLSGIVMGNVRDGIEQSINTIAKLSSLPANASKVEIKNAINQFNNDIKDFKLRLTKMVPYRALSGFFNIAEAGNPNWSNIKSMVSYIHNVNDCHLILPYVFDDELGLNKKVVFNESWIELIQDNTVSILGWIQYEKARWLQSCNPEVPGLVYKLSAGDEKIRKLNNVRTLWNDVLDITPITDVFTRKQVIQGKYDVDHFIPWSFVMNDELWNLMPMDPTLNSSKSNKIPKWDPYFKDFASNQYILYSIINTYSKIRDDFQKCYKDNLHSLWATQELYIPGNDRAQFYAILEKNMLPVYDSAKRQGYDLWQI